MKEDFYIASLMVSKLCHDLIGSSSTLAFSLEEILKEGECNKDATNLALKSSEVFISRLKYFRAALGVSFVNMSGSLVSDIRSLIFGLYKEKDIYISWPNTSDQLLEKFLNNINIKLFLNIFLLIFFHIPKSANVNVLIVQIKPNQIGVMLTVKGYKVILKENVMDIINGKVGIEHINPRNIHLYFIAFLKEETGSVIEINNNNNNEGLKLAFSLENV